MPRQHTHTHAPAIPAPPRTGSACMDENEIATSIRKSLTLEWPDCTWQVLVGRNFGSYVSFEESRYIYFYIAQVSGGGRLRYSYRAPALFNSHPILPPPSNHLSRWALWSLALTSLASTAVHWLRLCKRAVGQMRVTRSLGGSRSHATEGLTPANLCAFLRINNDKKKPACSPSTGAH